MNHDDTLHKNNLSAVWGAQARGVTLSRDAFKTETRFMPEFAIAASKPASAVSGLFSGAAQKTTPSTNNAPAPRYVVMPGRAWQATHHDGTTTTHKVNDIHVLDQKHVDQLLAQKRITEDQIFDRVGKASEAARTINQIAFEQCASDYVTGKHSGIKAWRMKQEDDAVQTQSSRDRISMATIRAMGSLIQKL